MTVPAPPPSEAQEDSKQAVDGAAGANPEVPSPTENAESSPSAPATEQQQENEVDEGETEEAGDDDEKEFAGKDAQTLLDDGKTFFRSKNWSKAAECFSRAVERRVAELDGSDFHPELSTYYLWFGDTLLTKEEQNAELFQFDKPKQEAGDSGSASSTSSGASASSSSSSLSSAPSAEKGENAHGSTEEEVPGGNAAGKVSDEELAFEMLEMAKRCLLKKLENSPPPGAAASSSLQACAKEEGGKSTVAVHTDVIDLSFAYVRLADMQLMNERYDEAAQDYGEAVALRERYHLPKETLMAPLLSLAQATFFSGKKTAALDVFKRTLDIGKEIKEGVLRMPDGMTADALADTIEDLQLQIADVEKQIAEEAAAGKNEEESTKGSQCAARDCIATTTSTFDTAQLDPSSAKVVRVSVRPRSAAVSVISGEGAPSRAGGNDDEEEKYRHSPKKRRIDLRQLQSSPSEQNAVKAAPSAEAKP
ncbi:tetratricopeptide repeat-containing protein [Besnoitia besnoiti]|uniref:Tetratricopeptide repeat-containing protein n=1 Tax=Besnoitia besnoiti TaxID=94643 RepID=A0A2A9MP95_BESBE|nr:tetratricopeptide repeat-containing protein [Besnoitia besnoiti]PFH37853.1 tetratricopeptide repeat-containing protein [Besnoitia besnoiti]